MYWGLSQKGIIVGLLGKKIFGRERNPGVPTLLYYLVNKHIYFHLCVSPVGNIQEMYLLPVSFKTRPQSYKMRPLSTPCQITCLPDPNAWLPEEFQSCRLFAHMFNFVKWHTWMSIPVCTTYPEYLVGTADKDAALLIWHKTAVHFVPRSHVISIERKPLSQRGQTTSIR